MFELVPHAVDRGVSVWEALTLRASIEQGEGDELHVVFELTGELGALRFPPVSRGEAVDGLWQHTCFEVFLASQGATDYQEWNLAPSGDWACYRFRDYRSPADDREQQVGFTGSPGTPRPKISWEHNEQRAVLRAQLSAALPASGAKRSLRVGLTAVLEDRSGRLGYWALLHPRDTPDFHDAAGFVACVEPLSQS